MKFKVELDSGKYTYIFDNGKQSALRYGEQWRDLSGDKFIYCLASEVDKQKELANIYKQMLIDNGVCVDDVKTSWD